MVPNQCNLFHPRMHSYAIIYIIINDEDDDDDDDDDDEDDDDDDEHLYRELLLDSPLALA